MHLLFHMVIVGYTFPLKAFQFGCEVMYATAFVEYPLYLRSTHCVPDTEEMESPGEMEKAGLGPAFK